MTFHSILFERSERETDADLSGRDPLFFRDLNLDQIVNAIVAGREQYDLKPFLYAPLQDVEEVVYRHEALGDLEAHGVRDAVSSFAEGMRVMRRRRDYATKLRHRYHRERWFRESIRVYCDAVISLTGELTRLDVGRVPSRVSVTT